MRRHFLDRVVTHFFELVRGNIRVTRVDISLKLCLEVFVRVIVDIVGVLGSVAEHVFDQVALLAEQVGGFLKEGTHLIEFMTVAACNANG